MQVNKVLFLVNIIEKASLSLQVLLKLYFSRDLNVFSHRKLGVVSYYDKTTPLSLYIRGSQLMEGSNP